MGSNCTPASPFLSPPISHSPLRHHVSPTEAASDAESQPPPDMFRRQVGPKRNRRQHRCMQTCSRQHTITITITSTITSQDQMRHGAIIIYSCGALDTRSKLRTSTQVQAGKSIPSFPALYMVRTSVDTTCGKFGDAATCCIHQGNPCSTYSLSRDGLHS